MAVGRESAASPSIFRTCLCFLFLLMRDHDICTANHDYMDYIYCSVSLGFLLQNLQRNGQMYFSPLSRDHHIRHLVNVIGRKKKRAFTHSRMPHYSNRSAVFNMELICSHGDIYEGESGSIIGF